MPLIYETLCSACDYGSDAHSEGYLAVIVDDPCTSMHAHPDEPRLVILGHPLESMILEEFGFTFTSAGLGGRMVYVKNVACKVCGTMYEIRHLGAGSGSLGGTGCLVMLGLSGAIGVAVGWNSESIFFGFMAGWFALLGFFALGDAILSPFIRWRYKDRVREFDRGPDCPKCHCKKYVGFPPRWGKLLCPKCGNQTVKVRTVGIS
jgi:hypothetical protein